jgi:hypothetical protein
MITGKKECQVIEMLKKLKVASATQISELLGEEKRVVQGRIQTLKRKGVVEGVGKVKKTLTTEFTYRIKPPEPKAKSDFVPTATFEQMRKFKKQIQGTPWAQLAVLI